MQRKRLLACYMSGCFVAFRTVIWLVALLAPLSEAQSASSMPVSAPSKLAADRSQEAFVVEQIIASATYEADGTGVRQTTQRVKIQSEAGVQRFGNLVFPYQKQYEAVDIDYVRVIKPDGQIILTPLDSVQDLDSEITHSAPLYSDFREKHVIVRRLSAGDVLEWQNTVHELKPLAPGQFWLHYDFTRRFIVLDEQFRLNIPKGKYVNVKSSKLNPQIQEQSGRRIYTWKHSQLEHEEDPKEKFGRPFFYPPPEIQISTFRSWEEVGHWYDSLQREQVTPTAGVVSKAAEITKNIPGEEAKIRALYSYVATNFRYVAVNFGIGRYQPHSAEEVLSNSYGDCKDKHTLLASLLQAVGITASPALISSFRTVDSDVPSPAQFDHVITVVQHGNDAKDLLWLDATSEVAPFGQLFVNLRDKKALVIPANRDAYLIKTPAEPAFAGLHRYHFTGSLTDSGHLEATIEHEVRGDPELILRTAFRRVPQPQWKDLIPRLSDTFAYSGTVSEVRSSSAEKTDEPFRFSYKYEHNEYSEWANRRIIAPLPAFTFPTLSDEHENSGEPVQLDAPEDMIYTADLRFPESYTVQPPKDTKLTSEFAEYQSSYTVTSGVLHVERHLVFKKKEVAASEYKTYREFQRKLWDDENSWVSFTQKAAGANTEVDTKDTADASTDSNRDPTEAAQWPMPPNTEAGHLYSEGINLARLGSISAALTKFEEAAKLDPTMPGVWSSIGHAQMMLHKNDAAIAAMRRQVQETPGLVLGYKFLGGALMSLHRDSEAIPLFREVLRLAPHDHDAHAKIGACLIRQKQYREAVNYLERAAEVNPRSLVIYTQLGNAYAASGDGDKAYQAYAKAIALDTSYSGTRNNAAYALAEKKLDLDKAVIWAQEAVHDKEDETRTVDLERLDPKDLRLMNQLSSYWDTYGWVNFFNRDFEAAERYLQAAWWLRQDTVIGDHLGQLYEKAGNWRKAVQFYSLAIACPDKGDKTLAREHLVKLFTAGAAPDGRRDARAELGQMRTILLPRITAKRASAEFFLLLTNNGEERSLGPAARPSASISPQLGAKAAHSFSPPSVIAAKSPRARIEQVKFIAGSQELRSAGEVLAKADFTAPFPDTAVTKVVRRGILVCEPGHLGCEFVLLSAESANSVN